MWLYSVLKYVSMTKNMDFHRNKIINIGGSSGRQWRVPISPILFAGLLESANSSILAVRKLFKEVVGEKNQDFMLIRFYFPIIWLDVVGTCSQSETMEGTWKACGGCAVAHGGHMKGVRRACGGAPTTHNRWRHVGNWKHPRMRKGYAESCGGDM